MDTATLTPRNVAGAMYSETLLKQPNGLYGDIKTWKEQGKGKWSGCIIFMKFQRVWNERCSHTETDDSDYLTFSPIKEKKRKT